MKNFFLSISTLILLVSFKSEDLWKEFKSKEGRFKVYVPGKMTEKTNDIETAVGTLTYHTFMYQPPEASALNKLYLVSYVDYPEGVFHRDSTELIKAFLETSVLTSVENMQGELRYNSDINEVGFQGKLWRIDYNKGKAVIKNKAFVVGNRYYSIQVATTEKNGHNRFIDKFLNSFVLVGE